MSAVRCLNIAAVVIKKKNVPASEAAVPHHEKAYDMGATGLECTFWAGVSRALSSATSHAPPGLMACMSFMHTPTGASGQAGPSQASGTGRESTQAPWPAGSCRQLPHSASAMCRRPIQSAPAGDGQPLSSSATCTSLQCCLQYSVSPPCILAVPPDQAAPCHAPHPW